MGSNPVFRSMQAQLIPTGPCREALRLRLAEASAGAPRRASWGRYAALAACAALLVAAYPVYRFLNRPLHSYTEVSSGGTVAVTQDAGGTVQANTAVGDGGGASGDRDMAMTAEELEKAMTEAGYAPEDIETFLHLTNSAPMTWANWWKFMHLDGNPRTLDALVEFFRRETAVPGGATSAEEADPSYNAPGSMDNSGALQPAEADAASQAEAIRLYQNLTGYFETATPGTYPAWYGGSFIRRDGWLNILIVDGYDSKELCLQIQDWAGGDRILFGSARYSLAYLRSLQEQVCALPELGRMHDRGWGCGVDEERNRVELTVPEAGRALLAALAVLDPAGDAIEVLVCGGVSVVNQVLPGGPG